MLTCPSMPESGGVGWLQAEFARSSRQKAQRVRNDGGAGRAVGRRLPQRSGRAVGRRLPHAAHAEGQAGQEQRVPRGCLSAASAPSRSVDRTTPHGSGPSSRRSTRTTSCSTRTAVKRPLQSSVSLLARSKRIGSPSASAAMVVAGTGTSTSTSCCPASGRRASGGPGPRARGDVPAEAAPVPRRDRP